MKKTLNLLPLQAPGPFVNRGLVVKAVVVVVVYVAAIFGLWMINSHEAKSLDKTIADLKGKRTHLQQLIAASKPFVKAKSGNQNVMALMTNTPPWDAVMQELSLVVPSTVWLEIVESQDAKHLRLKGFATSQTAVAKLIDSLERSRYFGNVEIVFSQKGKDATSFEVRAEMKWT